MDKENQCSEGNDKGNNISYVFIIIFDKSKNQGFQEGKPLHSLVIKIEYITELS